jgi:hypothetical protein
LVDGWAQMTAVAVRRPALRAFAVPTNLKNAEAMEHFGIVAGEKLETTA